MPQASLTYLDIKGLAELSRYVIKCGKLEVEDNRLQRGTFAEVKEQSPLGQMPWITLENGKSYGQSAACARYLANKCGLAGKTEEEKFHVDMVVECVKFDMFENIKKANFSPEDKKAEMLAAAFEKCNNWMDKLEAKYVYGDGTFLASGLSLADLAFFNLVNDFFPVASFALDEARFPKLHNVVKKTAEVPEMAAWLAARPVTNM